MKKKFSRLDPVSRVKAVLATATQPISRPMVFAYAEIDAVTNLDRAKAAKIEKLLETTEVEKGKGHHMIPTPKKKAAMRALGIEHNIVIEHITIFLQKNFGFTEEDLSTLPLHENL